MKRALTILLLLVSTVTVGQVVTIRVPDSVTAFGINLPRGTEVYDLSNKMEWKLDTATASTATLQTATKTRINNEGILRIFADAPYSAYITTNSDRAKDVILTADSGLMGTLFGNEFKLKNIKRTLASLDEKSYNSLTDIPSTFAPSSHTQAISTITNLQDSLNDRYRRKDTATVLLSILRAGHDYALIGHNHSGTYDNYGSWSFHINGSLAAPIYSGSIVNLCGGYGVNVDFGGGYGYNPTLNIDSARVATQHDILGMVTGTPWTSMGYILSSDSNKTSAGNYITRKFVTDNFSAIGHTHAGYLTAETLFLQDSAYIAYLTQANEFNRDQTIKSNANNGRSYLNIKNWEDNDSTGINFGSSGGELGWDIGTGPSGMFKIQSDIDKPIVIYSPHYSANRILTLNASKEVTTTYSITNHIYGAADDSIPTVTAVRDYAVPYTGAITDVNLGNHTLTANEAHVNDSLTSANFMITKEGGYAVKMVAGCALEQGDVVCVTSAGTATKTSSATVYNSTIGVAYNTASASGSVYVVVNGRALVKFTSQECNGDDIVLDEPNAGNYAAVGQVFCDNTPYPNMGEDGKAVNVTGQTGFQIIGVILETKSAGQSAYIMLTGVTIPPL